MFLIIGERINMTRTKLRDRVWARDEEFVASEAKMQASAGAHCLDVNAGADPGREVEDMRWLTGVIAQAVDLPLCFDSANPQALRAGLEVCNRPGTIINSITLERDRFEAVAELAQEFGTQLIALTMDDGGMPEDVDGRVRVARDLAAKLAERGIGLERVYFDLLVRPAATNPGQVAHFLEAMRVLRAEVPDIKFLAGLSNVSFGLPKRKLLNRVFLTMLVAAGCDGALIDPTDSGMIATLYASRAVLGQDAYGIEYLQAVREGKF